MPAEVQRCLPIWPMQWASTTDLSPTICIGITQFTPVLRKHIEKNIKGRRVVLYLYEFLSKVQVQELEMERVCERERGWSGETNPFWESSIKRNSCTVGKQVRFLMVPGLLRISALIPARMQSCTDVRRQGCSFLSIFTYYFNACTLMFLYCI